MAAQVSNKSSRAHKNTIIQRLQAGQFHVGNRGHGACRGRISAVISAITAIVVLASCSQNETDPSRKGTHVELSIYSATSDAAGSHAPPSSFSDSVNPTAKSLKAPLVIPKQWGKELRKRWKTADGQKSLSLVMTEPGCLIRNDFGTILDDRELLSRNSGFGQFGSSTKGFAYGCAVTTRNNALVGRLTFIAAAEPEAFNIVVNALNEDPDATSQALKAPHPTAITRPIPSSEFSTDSTITAGAAPTPQRPEPNPDTINFLPQSVVLKSWDTTTSVGTTYAYAFNEERKEIVQYSLFGYTKDQFDSVTDEDLVENLETLLK